MQLMAPKDRRLVWIDTETTGLVPEDGFILEIGIAVTDLDLVTFDEFHRLLWVSPGYDKYVTEAALGEQVWDMHNKSNLISDAVEGGVDPTAVQEDLLDWLKEIGLTKDEPMCGSSVQFDRKWLEHHFEPVADMFSYRNIDTSTIKEVCRRFNPIVYSRLDEVTQPKKLHRVLPDLEDTINEFQFYRDNFFFDAVSGE